jgi:hypothetical protein
VNPDSATTGAPTSYHEHARPVLTDARPRWSVSVCLQTLHWLCIAGFGLAFASLEVSEPAKPDEEGRLPPVLDSTERQQDLGPMWACPRPGLQAEAPPQPPRPQQPFSLQRRKMPQLEGVEGVRVRIRTVPHTCPVQEASGSFPAREHIAKVGRSAICIEFQPKAFVLSFESLLRLVRTFESAWCRKVDGRRVDSRRK